MRQLNRACDFCSESATHSCRRCHAAVCFIHRQHFGRDELRYRVLCPSCLSDLIADGTLVEMPVEASL